MSAVVKPDVGLIHKSQIFQNNLYQIFKMTETKLLLAELDTVLRKYNIVEYTKLQPPLPDEEIDKYFEEFGIEDEDLKALYQWKDGEQADSYSKLMKNGGIQSLQEVKKYLSFDKLYDTDLLEIISDNGEEALLFNKREGPHYGKLYFYSVPCLYIEHPISYFDSINAMLRTTIEAYKEGAYQYDDKARWLNIDRSKFATIAKKININSRYWTKHDPLREEDWYEI